MLDKEGKIKILIRESLSVFRAFSCDMVFSTMVRTLSAGTALRSVEISGGLRRQNRDARTAV